MRPLGLKRCKGKHGSNCLICHPITHKQAVKIKPPDYSEIVPSRTRAKREAAIETAAQMEQDMDDAT